MYIYSWQFPTLHLHFPGWGVLIILIYESVNTGGGLLINSRGLLAIHLARSGQGPRNGTLLTVSQVGKRQAGRNNKEGNTRNDTN